MSPSADRDPRSGGSQSVVDAPGDELRDAEAHNVGGVTTEGEMLATAAVEAGPRRRFEGLSVVAWLSIGWLALVLIVAVMVPILPVGDPKETIHLERPCPTVERFNRQVEQCTIQGKGPFSTDGTNTRSTFWPESDWRKAIPELRAPGASLSATSANCPAPPVCFLCRYVWSARP